MLTAARSFAMSANSSPLLPQPKELQPLWDWGVQPREGQLIQIAGRSGSQKSGFVLFWVAQMGLPTLYFSGDMTSFEATSRLVSMQKGMTIAEIEAGLEHGRMAEYQQDLDELPITFAFGEPITWSDIDANIDAYMELHNCYPKIMVVDNLMDMAGCESGYEAQQAAWQDLTRVARETGMTVIVIHHATDKTEKGELLPGQPPSRREIKNGGSEKPQLILTVALYSEEGMAQELRVACVKQRSGKSDVAAKDIIRLMADPARTRFWPRGSGMIRY